MLGSEMRLSTWKYWPWLRDAAVLLLIIIGIRSYQQRDLPRGELPDIAGTTLEGAPVSLASYRGKPVLLHFWATWCGVCRAEQSTIDSLAHNLPVLSVVSQSGSQAEIAAYVAEHHIAAPVLVDQANALVQRLQIHAYPTTFVLNGNGAIRFSEVGYSTELGLRARMWLAGLW